MPVKDRFARLLGLSNNTKIKNLQTQIDAFGEDIGTAVSAYVTANPSAVGGVDATARLNAELQEKIVDVTTTAGSALTWELGTIQTGGVEADSTTRIRTDSFIHCNKGRIALTNYPTYSMLVVVYDLKKVFKSATAWLTAATYDITDQCYIRVLLRKTDNSTISSSNVNAIGGYFTYYDVSLENKFKAIFGSIGQAGAAITTEDAEEYALAAVKFSTNRKTYGTSVNPATVHLPIGYLYHLQPVSTSRKIYYSANRADNPAELGTLDFDPLHYQCAVGESGEIIWVHDGLRTTKPRVNEAGTYNSSSELTTDVIPITWLQNQGIDFSKDSNGDEYCIFGEYIGGSSGDMYIWKVTKPYSTPSNWRRVLTVAKGADMDHFHTVNYDPYYDVWYATSGDTDAQSRWWYSTDEGENWTDLVNGSTVGWPASVARVVGLVFTSDYIYWGNDYGTNHCLSRVSRDVNGVADPATRVKVTDLNTLQSTYATVLMHSPRGLLMIDRVDTAFGTQTDELNIEFWSLDDEKLYKLATLKRSTGHTDSPFGFRCRAYSLYQGTYDTRLIMGFGLFPNWIDVPYNDTERRATMTLEIV